MMARRPLEGVQLLMESSFPWIARVLGVVVVCLTFFGSPAALAQGKPADCEEKVKTLEEQVKQLSERLKALSQENDDLRKQLKDKGGGRPSSGPSGKPAEGSDQTTGALASPGAIFEALVKDYNAKFASKPKDSKPEQAKLLAEVREWVRGQAKAIRGPVTWTIEVVDAQVQFGARTIDVTFVTLDARGKPTGPEFTAPFPSRFNKELVAGKGKRFKLVGTAGAQPEVNAKRTEKGPDDEPLFIGPYAEFGFDVTVTSLTPVEAGDSGGEKPVERKPSDKK